MIKTSWECGALISRGARMRVRLDVTLAGGQTLELTGANIRGGGMSVTRSVSPADSIEVGAAIIGRMALTLTDADGALWGKGLSGAEVAPYVGPELSDGSVEWVPMGVYDMQPPKRTGKSIAVECLDPLHRAEVPYSSVKTAYPATLGKIASDVCSACGIQLASASFANSDYVVAERPDDANLTCLQVLSHVGQAAGCWARCNGRGKLEFGWFDAGAFDGEDWLDGGCFDEGDPYTSGDAADGGDFLDYSSGDAIDGGHGLARYAHVFAHKSLAIGERAVRVTGVQVTAEDSDEGDEGETAVSGGRGYVLSIEGNPLVRYGQASKVASRVAAATSAGKLRFRSFSCSLVADPRIEPGDAVAITDRDQAVYMTYATSVTYRLSSSMRLSCGVENESPAAVTSSKSKTKASAQVKQEVKREAKARKKAVAQTNKSVATISSDLSTAKSDIGTISSDLSTAKSDIGTISSDLSTAKSDIGTISSDLSKVKSTVEGKSDADHKHKAADITSGTLPVSRGGTGSSSASAARTALGAAASSHSHPISDVTGLQSALDGKASKSHTHPSPVTFRLSDGTLYITTS